MPVISVIVPVYKVEQYLHRCVDSILGQTYKDFELILVDDGSPDNCGRICDEYAKQDPRVVVIHQQNGGLSAARNAGIDWAFANSDSQWLFFVDSDDFIHPKTLRSLLDAADKYGTDISIGGFAETSGSPPLIKDEELVCALWSARDFFIQENLNATVAWGKLYKKHMFQHIRYPVGRIHEDEFVTYKLLFACEKVTVLPFPLYAYYVNAEGITRQSWYPNRMDVLDAFRERIRFFQEKNDPTLVDMTVRSYANSIARNYENAKSYSGCRKDLRRRLRKLLLSRLPLFPPANNEWLYSIAFPRATYLAMKMAPKRKLPPKGR